MLIFLALIVFLNSISSITGDVRIGILLGDEDTATGKIIDYAFRKSLSTTPNFIIFKERIAQPDAFHYHHAICKLLNKGVEVLLTPIGLAYFPTLIEYSNKHKLSIVAPSYKETAADPRAPDLQTKYVVGVKPSTLRPMLDFIRYAEWEDMVYIYDDDEGLEKLQTMYQISYTALALRVLGISRVQTATEANEILRRIDSLGKHRTYHVILDTSASLAQDILQLHVHDTVVGKKNYFFLLSSPTLKSFWTLHEFGALKISGFLALPERYQENKDEKEEWIKLTGYPPSQKDIILNVSDYYFHDSAIFLSQAIRDVGHKRMDLTHNLDKTPSNRLLPDCFVGETDGRIADILYKVSAQNGLTGPIQFRFQKGKRIHVNLTLVESNVAGYREVGYWTDIGYYGGLRMHQDSFSSDEPESLPQISDKKFLRITSMISPPYLMLKSASDGVKLTGNDRFDGFCKDIVDAMCSMLQIDCQLVLVEDGTYGQFDSTKHRWSGIIGDIIRGAADVAVADLVITGKRQRVVEFTEPIDVFSFSLLLKHPDFVHASSSMFFALNAFSANVWVCILAAAIVFSILFHAITKFTGAPDNIDAASGIWGRKNGITLNTWFSLGNSMMQNTGVFPRSISSRLLTGAWWFSTLVFLSLLIASITSQLRGQDASNVRSPRLSQLKAMSVESILLESLTRGWPKVGTVSNNSLSLFIRKSQLPLYRRFSKYMDENPDVLVSSFQEGVKRVRESHGGYILMAETTRSDFISRQKPCDLVVIEDTNVFGGYGVAYSPLLDNALKTNISDAITQIQRNGLLGHLHRKWWIEAGQCKDEEYVSETKQGTFYSMSGFLCLMAVGFILMLITFSIQFSRRIQDKQSRMQQLTFEDMNLDNQLPTPPPELLNPPPIDLATRL